MIGRKGRGRFGDERGAARIRCGLLLLAALIGVAAMAGASDLRKEWLARRRRLIGRDVRSIPGHVVDWFAQGARTWAETNRLAAVNAPAGPERWSKLKFIRALKSRNRWAAVRAFIHADPYRLDEWNACAFLQSGDPGFVSVTNAAMRSGLLPPEEAAAVLLESRD